MIPRPLAGRVRAAVDAGDYASVNDVVGEALRLWAERREGRVHDLEALRAAYREGKASGEPRPLDVHRIIQEAGRRMTDRARG